MRKAVFLDRDGIVNRAIVLNGKPYPPLKIKAVYLNDGIIEVVKRLQALGYLIIVVTNQPDVANNLVSKRTVNKINEYLKSLVGFDDIFTCYHNDKDHCDCRKPKTGLFKKAKELYEIEFSESYVVGDRKKDIDAGKAIGAKTIFVDYAYLEEPPKNATYYVTNISKILDIIK